MMVNFEASLSHAEPVLPNALKDFVQKLEGQQGPDFQIAIVIAEIPSGSVVFEHNGGKLFAPASTLKLLTTVSALRVLGGGYRFPTEVFVDRLPSEGTARSGILPDSEDGGRDLLQPRNSAVGTEGPDDSVGNLYLRGYGDPTLDNGRLSELAQAVYQHGVRNVQDLIIDDSLFIDPDRASGPNIYDAPLSATSVNGNVYAISVAPSKPGSPAFVSLTTGAPYSLVGRVNTIRAGGNDIKVDQNPPSQAFVPGSVPDRPLLQTAARTSVTVQGNIGSASDAAVYYETVPDPPAYAAGLFLYYLKQAGIAVRGKIARGETTGSAKRLEVIQSRELSSILEDMNHLSSNFIAGQILYVMGQDAVGYFRKDLGIRRISETVEQLGVDSGGVSIYDGSGFDRRDRITAGQLIKILVGSYNDFSIAPNLLSSLSRFGFSGTLKQRRLFDAKQSGLRGENLRQAATRAASVWGKTGTLTGVSSLAGYLQMKSGGRAAFAIMINGPEDKAVSAGIEEDLLKLILGLPWSGPKE